MHFVFYCAHNYRFDDRALEGRGVGGSENALTLLTRTLAQRGHRVQVFNEPDDEGTYHGVQYLALERFTAATTGDVFVLFRSAMPLAVPTVARFPRRIFWCCDQRSSGNWTRDIFPFMDAVVCISRYHAQYVIETHRCPPHLMHVIPVGIEAERYQPLPAKIRGKLLYCSDPNRGLVYLTQLFPAIRREVPEATLYVTSDYRLWGVASPGNARFVRLFQHMPGVTFLGKVPRAELIQHQRESELMVYPCTFEENFCIAAMECQAAGAPVITTRIGALETTIVHGQTGIVLDDHPATARYQQQFIQDSCRLLRDRASWTAMSARARERALREFAWERLAEQWETLVTEPAPSGATTGRASA